MWWRKAQKQKSDMLGFTILEVLIVLAVSAAMFVSVAIVINGKQQNAQFQTSVNEAKLRISQVANEVASGYYPEKMKTMECDAAYNLQTAMSTSNGRCTMIGKALHFYSTTQPDFDVYSIVGKDTDDGQYNNAQMILAAQSNRGGGHRNVSTTYDVTESRPLTYGLKAKTMRYTSGVVTRDIGSFAFAQSLNADNLGGVAAGGTNAGASQYLKVLVFPSTTTDSRLSNDKLAEANAINKAFDDKKFEEANGKVSICFDSGSTEQHAVISIGTTTGANSVSSVIQTGLCP